MSTQKARAWLEAAKVLAADPRREVRCPENDDGFLAVHDEVAVADPTMMERYLICPVCGARNVLRMKVPSMPN